MVQWAPMSSKPLTIVIFGATGDLFQKKLASALFDLYQKGLLPEKTEIVGFSRKTFSHDQFRAYIQNALAAKANGKVIEPEEFVSKAFYHQGDLSNADSYASLGAFLAERDTKNGVCSDKLFYLAVPPSLYETVFTKLSKSGLAIPCAPGLPNEEKAWTRVLVEKPFGNNEVEAEHLDQLLGKLFEEDQIFRIDHYLAKEAVQNIVSFRFSNGLFEPLWSSKHIERVEILFLKEGTAGGRGAFFDPVGELRDVGQNHMLQMLALVAMENPGAMGAESIRSARCDVLRKVSVDIKKLAKHVVRGQYEGYRSEVGVRPESDTETYFKMTAHIANKRWKGVPFIFESGKALNRSAVEIHVYFKPAPCLCPKGHESPHQNVLTFNISDESISVLFWAKKPGFHFELESKTLSFSFGKDAVERQGSNAYERVLLDVIRGDQTLFASTEEVKAQWKIITPILEKWVKVPLQQYEKGSEGPGNV
ncbi:MAG: glucose-6-phosphate dehydrogenase [Candidatus Taylorbacteria bacterium CG11_big_fil_rev_8_21_14_0_20_46_11]|uniref:Glucose-6-phosphate 1-dehydrogenase n=1 Tax=Candidatus Taylorbacteria bacterium CG11_big_fil_rev_8_21_14_0_20_46_11 TaxID=1975025 RepID=A0A2H0KBJ1_9BACT|nr:MAG: glucose-6-phosphate dehydrogenase [Candidatus Taylorbacteria bacterium CG11_big_fil_rev_8_21_14_0_20_46_11]